MRKMKETSIPWLPEVAEDFSVGYVKQYFFVSKDLSNEGEPERVLKLARAGIVEKDVTTNEGQMAASYAGYNKVQVGDLLLNPMDLYSGANCNVSELNGVISPAYSNLRAKKAGSIVPKFYDYYFKCQYWLMAMFAHGKGVSFDNRWTLNNDSLRAYEIPVVPYAVQWHIVECIQSEERKVDALIENVQTQIEKLKAYKQSLITEVVTKGLDPSVPMKDSGIEWIGEIPAHWEVKRGKVLFKESDARSADGSEELLTVSQYTGITPRSQKNVNMFEALTLEGYKICNIGDIAANTMWLWSGAIGVSAYRGVISPSYNVYLQKAENYIPGYLDCLLRAPMLVQEYASRSTGIRASRLRLYPKDFLDIMFPVPPIGEQQEIMNVLSEKFAAVDKLVAIKQSKIEKLEQYKKSLIYEYVTGKKEA